MSRPIDDEAREYLRRLYSQPTDPAHPDWTRYLELLAAALGDLADAAETYRFHAEPPVRGEREWAFRRASGRALVVALDPTRGLVAWRLEDGRRVPVPFEPQVAYDPSLDALVGRLRLQDGARRSVLAELAMALLGALTG